MGGEGKNPKGPKTLQEYKKCLELQQKSHDLLVRENKTLREFVEKIKGMLGGIQSTLCQFRREQLDLVSEWSVYSADKQREELITADAAAERRRTRRR